MSDHVIKAGEYIIEISFGFSGSSVDANGPSPFGGRYNVQLYYSESADKALAFFEGVRAGANLYDGNL